MPRQNLNSNLVSALKEPGEYYDTNERSRGLILRVMKSGPKRWELRYHSSGKARRYHIGHFPELSLKEARDQVGIIKGKIRLGDDPQDERRQARFNPDALTFAQLVELFNADHMPKLKESTRRDYKSRINKHLLPEFGLMRISSIQRGNVRRLLKPIAEKQPVQANRLHAILSKIFSYAVNEELTDNHPVKGLSKYGQETRRDRYYSKIEIRALWAAFEAEGEPLRSLLMVLLLTGQRLGETSRMKWVDIDAARGVWIIPQGETKGGRTHVVPIIGKAKDILETLHPLSGRFEYVFTSPMKNDRPVSYFRSVAERTRKVEGCPADFRIHDLRRTMATYCAGLGVDRTTLGKLLNHRGLAGDSHVTSIYDRHEYLDEKRRALVRWDHYLEQILSGKTEAANIFKIG